MTPQQRSEIKEWDCKYRVFNPFAEEPTPLQISADDVFGKYTEMGFENFKIEGRATNPVVISEQIVRYLAKPEKLDEARYIFLMNVVDMGYLNF